MSNQAVDLVGEYFTLHTEYNQGPTTTNKYRHPSRKTFTQDILLCSHKSHDAYEKGQRKKTNVKEFIGAMDKATDVGAKKY